MGTLNSGAKLCVCHCSKRYGDQQILQDVSFTVQDGEFLSILGPSGCGKTTLLRILTGLVRPDEGTVLKDGQDITHLPPDRRKIGIVFQNYALFENMTVLKNVAYALRFTMLSGERNSPWQKRFWSGWAWAIPWKNILASSPADSSSGRPLPAHW